MKTADLYSRSDKSSSRHPELTYYYFKLCKNPFKIALVPSKVTVTTMFQLWSFFSSIRSVTLLWICLLSPSDGFMTKSPYFATIHACSRYLPSSSRHQNNNQLMMNAPARVPNKRDRKVESILEAVDFSRRPVAPSTPLMDDPLMGMIGSILNAADARKATYLSAFRISSVTGESLFLPLSISSLSISPQQPISLSPYHTTIFHLHNEQK